MPSIYDKYKDFNNSVPGIILKTLDPTGISSYPDVYSEGRNLWNNPTLRNAGNFGIELLGAIPFVGKVGKAAKAVTRSLRSARRTLRNTPSVVPRLPTFTIGIRKDLVKGGKQGLGYSSRILPVEKDIIDYKNNKRK